MLRDEKLAELCRELDLELDCYSFQLLWLMPIIEIMWADGRCQREEVETLFHYMDRFVSIVNVDVPQITRERARRFFMPLLDISLVNVSAKRDSLVRLVNHIIENVVEPALQDKRLHLYHICHEVAAAAHTDNGPGKISLEEERLLQGLFRDLRLGSFGRF